jgi:hypothetical protein
MTEALASKTCTPCRGGIPPLTREQAELFHAQAPDWQLARKLTASGGASGFAISARRLPSFQISANLLAFDIPGGAYSDNHRSAP